MFWTNIAKYDEQENGKAIENVGNQEQIEEDQFSDSEILDELTTHRGELKIRTTSFRSERWASSGRPEMHSRAISMRDDRRFRVSYLYILKLDRLF